MSVALSASSTECQPTIKTFMATASLPIGRSHTLHSPTPIVTLWSYHPKVITIMGEVQIFDRLFSRGKLNVFFWYLLFEKIAQGVFFASVFVSAQYASSEL